MIFTKEIIRVASFDLIDTEELDAMIWYFPEEEKVYRHNGMQMYIYSRSVISGHPCRNK